jgi:DNA-binding GntR family transcriptional regulator
MATGGTIRSRVERSLGSRIAAGLVPAGTLLTVPSLAAEFAVSATPVREAVLELERRGFLAPVANRGFVVTEVGAEHARQVAEVRLLLEPAAMRLLTGHLRPEDERAARALAGTIVERAAAGDLEAYLEADRDFHLALTDFAGNPMLTAVVEDLRRRTRIPGIAALIGSEALHGAAAEHGQLLDLIVAGDADGAEALMRHHIGATIAWWAESRDTAPAE